MLERTEPAQDGAEAACRTAAYKSVAKFVESLPNTLTEQEHYDRLRRAFDATAKGVEHCLENFDPELHLERRNAENLSRKEQACIIAGVQEGIYKMHAFVDEMQKSPLADVNGTSVIFDQCAKRTDEIRAQLPTARAVMENGPYSIGNIDDDGFVPLRVARLKQTLVVAAGYIAGIFLIFDDMLAA